MSSRHQHISDRVFIAGDLDDVPAIEQLLSTLGPNAYGQVFVETLDVREVRPLVAPGRVTVTWLVRSERPSRVRPLIFSERGEALADAIAGWVAEWMPGEVQQDAECLMWIGRAASVAPSVKGSLRLLAESSWSGDR